MQQVTRHEQMLLLRCCGAPPAGWNWSFRYNEVLSWDWASFFSHDKWVFMDGCKPMRRHCWCVCVQIQLLSPTHSFPWRGFAVSVETLQDATPPLFPHDPQLTHLCESVRMPFSVKCCDCRESLCVCQILTSLLPALCLKARFRGSDTSALVVVIAPSPSGVASHGVSWTMYVHFFSNSVSVHVLMSVSSISTSTSVSVMVSAPSDSVLLVVAAEAILGCVSSCSMVCAPSLVNVAELWEVAFTRRTQKRSLLFLWSGESQRADGGRKREKEIKTQGESSES